MCIYIMCIYTYIYIMYIYIYIYIFVCYSHWIPTIYLLNLLTCIPSWDDHLPTNGILVLWAACKWRKCNLEYTVSVCVCYVMGSVEVHWCPKLCARMLCNAMAWKAVACHATSYHAWRRHMMQCSSELFNQRGYQKTMYWNQRQFSVPHYIDYIHYTHYICYITLHYITLPYITLH